MMKVLTNNVLIEGEEFVLITDEFKGMKYYGTIPYSEVEKGRLKRKLNGLDMCVSFYGIGEAIEARRETIRFKNEGIHTEAELKEYFLSL